MTLGKRGDREKIAKIKKWFQNHQKQGHFEDVNFSKIFKNVSYKDIWSQDDVKDVHFANLTKDGSELTAFFKQRSIDQ